MEEREISIKELIHVVWSGKFLIIILAAAFLIVGSVGAFVMEKSSSQNRLENDNRKIEYQLNNVNILTEKIFELSSKIISDGLSNDDFIIEVVKSIKEKYKCFR